MSHLAGNCDCGRSIHYPKHAQYGHKWRCHNCGKTWTLTTHGNPLHDRRSLPPRYQLDNTSESSISLGTIVIGIIVIIALL
jgi:transposase-like protein